MFNLFKFEKQTLQFFITCLRPFRLWFVGLFVVTTCIAISSTLKPYALRELLNFWTANEHDDAFLGLGGAALFYILSSLFPVIIFRLHNFIWVNFGPALRHKVTSLSMQHVFSHPYSYFQNQPAASVANAIKEIVTTIPDFIKTIFDDFLCVFLTLVIAVITVWSVNYKFAIGLITWVTTYIIVSIYILKHAKKIGKQGIKLRSKILAKIVEILENIKCIRLLTREELEQKKLNRILNQYLIIDKKKESCTVRAFAFQGISFVVYQGICLYWLIDGLKLRTLSIGDFALILTINVVFVDYLRKASQNFADLADLLGKIEQGVKIIVDPIKQEKRITHCLTENKPVELSAVDRIKGKIIFKNVSFNYDGFLPLFQNKSICIDAGEKVAIVGHSGSGKSTFINLILRLYDVTSGEIWVDDTNIQNLSLYTLRRAIGVVPQCPSLFCGTIMENIRYGRIEATDYEVIEAAKQAEIHEFVSKLALGYQTRIGSFGITLSAGQCQRIAIARVLLKNASILILDEAMSNLDAVTEEKIQDSLLKFIQGKTTLLITHRPSPLLLSADKILVFEQGKIIASGKHPELLGKSNLYRKLWKEQGSAVTAKKII